MREFNFVDYLILWWFPICIFVILSFFLYKFIKFHRESKFIIEMFGDEHEFSAKVLLEEKQRYLSYSFMDTINAFRKLVDLKYGSRNGRESGAVRSLSNFTDSTKLDSLFKIFQIYKEIKKGNTSESFLVDFCKTKLERFNSSFSVAKNYSDSFLYPYDEIKKFFDQVGCDCDDSGFDYFLKSLNPELHKKVQYMQEWMKEGPVASRYDNLLEKVLSFERVKDVTGNAKTFWERLVLDCGRGFTEQVQEDAQTEISKKLVFVLTSQKFGFLEDLPNFEEIGKITKKYIKPEHVLVLHALDKQKISMFL